MSLKHVCPCDISGICPYDAIYNYHCEWYCGADEPQDDPPEWEDDSGDE